MPIFIIHNIPKMRVLIILFVVIPFLLVAQNDTTNSKKDTTYWSFSNKFGVNFNFSDFSDNWTGGGTDAISLSTFLNSRAKYQKDKLSFTSSLELLYGQQRQDNDIVPFRKTQDKIFFNNKLGYDINDTWDMNFNLQFLTQFDEGFRFPKNEDEEIELISDFLSPAFLTASLGFSYNPEDYFTLNISPFAPRVTFVTDTSIYNSVPGNYGVEIGEKVRYEWYAFQLIADFDRNISETLNIKARYQLFANYEELTFEKVDHRLDMSITSKVTKFISVNLTTIAIYDFDQIDEVQFSTNLGLGVLFTF